MKNYFIHASEQLEIELAGARAQSESPLQIAGHSIRIIQAKLSDLKVFVAAHGFKDKNEEIVFFKEVKPNIYAQLIYFLRLFKLESKRPDHYPGLYRQLIENELKEIQLFLSQNLEFYQYLKSGSSHFDEQYFTRRDFHLQPGLDDLSLILDTSFSTPYSCKAAQVIAYEQLSSYLESVLQETDAASEGDIPQMKWTASKTALVELIYAFQTSGVFNNGSSDLREVAAFFENLFGLKLGNYYRVFQDIRIRKSGRTTFLDELKERLTRRMDETDECPKGYHRAW